MNLNLRTLSNHFRDVHLISLATWRQANEISPRDRRGPYVILQEGYDPDDLTMTADEFVLGRSGKWLSLGRFYQLPVPERRAEFVFGTVAEIVEMMNNLPSKPAMFGRKPREDAALSSADDGMSTAIQTGKQAGEAGAK